MKSEQKMTAREFGQWLRRQREKGEEGVDGLPSWDEIERISNPLDE